MTIAVHHTCYGYNHNENFNAPWWVPQPERCLVCERATRRPPIRILQRSGRPNFPPIKIKFILKPQQSQAGSLR